LLLPASDEELRLCAALADRAVAAKASVDNRFYPYFLLAKGLAEYRQGRLKSAIAIMEGEASKVLKPVPQIVIAMAQHKAGDAVAARKTFATAILAFDWKAELADNRDFWIRHILRREAETMILPNLASFLRGNNNVQDNYERLGLLGVCQFQDTYAAAARLYVDAFAEDPGLAEDWKKSHRFRAASFAALAGCGHGADASTLSGAERTALRNQARVWLHEELSAYIRRLKSNPSDSVVVRQSLVQWQASPALVGLREAHALEKLTEEERKECTELWKKVGAAVDSIQVVR
jgi:serine/threonine-protein kinase